MLGEIMYGDKKDLDDTKRFITRLADDLKKSRSRINDLLAEITRYPHAAHTHTYELATEHCIVRYRTVLFQYLTGSISIDDLKHSLERAFYAAVVEYRGHDKDKEDETTLRIKTYVLDYLIKAMDTLSERTDTDNILICAEVYPRLESVADVFVIEQPTTFSGMNTEDEVVEGD